jgi:hypothetical protein
MINIIEKIVLIFSIIFILSLYGAFVRSGCPLLFLGMYFIVVDLKIDFGIFRVVPIFKGKFTFWLEDFFAYRKLGIFPVALGLL